MDPDGLQIGDGQSWVQAPLGALGRCADGVGEVPLEPPVAQCVAALGVVGEAAGAAGGVHVGVDREYVVCQLPPR